MKILILSSEFPPGPGGIGTHAYQLARFFSINDQQVLVLSPQDYIASEEWHAFNQQQAFDIVSLQQGKNSLVKAFYRVKALIRALKKFDPGMVIVTGGRSIWIGGLILPMSRIPWLIIGHGTEFGLAHGLKAWFTRFCANKADGIICVSEYTRAAMRRMGIKKPPCFVVHNGADAEQYHPLPTRQVQRFREEHEVMGKFILLTVGNVSDRKGQEVLIRALPTIRVQLPNVVYWMAGLPQKKDALEVLAQSLGVDDIIRFWGRTSNDTLRDLYNACDLFVMTSRQMQDGDFEGYGIAVIEAALCAKAAVVSDNSGLAEAVQHERTGLLVPQNDPAAAAVAVLELAADRHKLEQLSTYAQEKALEQQTWQKVVARYMQIIEELLN